MNISRHFILVSQPAIIILVAGVLGGCASAQPKAGHALFDGKTLDGWVKRGPATYTVEDGTIVGTSVSASGNSFLCTEKDYGDFILELDVLADTNLNSGIQIRSHCYEEPTTFVANGRTNTIPAGRVHGYQIEVDNQQARRWSGGIYEEARRGWLVNLEDKPAAQQAFKFGDWNAYRIECAGPTIRTWVNGVPVAELHDEEGAREGFIALQVHGTRQEGLQVRFRNIRLREIKSPKSSSTSDGSKGRAEVIAGTDDAQSFPFTKTTL